MTSQGLPSDDRTMILKVFFLFDPGSPSSILVAFMYSVSPFNVFVYSLAKETRQFLICPRFVINLVKIYNLVIGHVKQLN